MAQRSKSSKAKRRTSARKKKGTKAKKRKKTVAFVEATNTITNTACRERLLKRRSERHRAASTALRLTMGHPIRHRLTTLSDNAKCADHEAPPPG